MTNLFGQKRKNIFDFTNDKKIDYWPNNRFFVGFWKEGKQNGVGKYIKNRKREK